MEENADTQQQGGCDTTYPIKERMLVQPELLSFLFLGFLAVDLLLQSPGKSFRKRLFRFQCAFNQFVDLFVCHKSLLSIC